MTIYATYGPDPIWVLLMVGAVGSMIVGRVARVRLGTTLARRLVIAGGLLLAGLLAYSLLATWLLPGPA